MGSNPTPAAPTAWTRLQRALSIAVAALALSLFFHSPRLWILAEQMPGSTYWDRGLQFMQQCDAPLGAPLSDAALVWRLAPALLAKALGLHGTGVLLVPWLGVLVLLALCAWLVLKRTGDSRMALLVTVLIGTTHAVLTPTGWLGVNDAWYAAALLAVAFHPSLLVLLLAALAGPWVDERFVLALPLALYVRSAAMIGTGSIRRALLLAGGSVLLYLLIRVFNPLHVQTGASHGYWTYIRGHFLEWWPWTSLGWFMGLRAAWVLVAASLADNFRSGGWRSVCLPALLAAAPLVMMNVLASDTGRAPTMLLPLVLLGAERIIVQWGLAQARRIVTTLVIANFLLPAMHVTYRSGDIINMLPLELFRLFRH